MVSPQHNTLTLQGRTLSLQPKVMAVLAYLARHNDRVVSNDELLDHVWQGRVVTHASVQKSMNTLRNALAELAELAGEREFVAHFSKRGYQLVVPVNFAPEATPANQPELPATPAAVPHRRKRIAVWAVVPAALLLLSVLIWLNREPSEVAAPIASINHHITAFTAAQPVAVPGKRDRSAEPHPDGRRIALLRDLVDGDEPQSQILIRETGGADWLLAAVDGFWTDLAWSPSGRNLVAIEIRRAEGLPWSPDYFEKPNYLYTFHIFTLDFRGERLLEKNLLSQWQGAVESVTWWDDNTLEFVASLGPGSNHERYRYLIAEQKLSVVNPLESGFTPLRSAVQEKMAAVASRQRNQVQVEIFDAQQRRLAVAPVPTAALDISWIPDGSGVLIFEKDNKKLSLLDLTGAVKPVQLTFDSDLTIARPRFNRDGKSLLLTASAAKADFHLLNVSASRLDLARDKRLSQPPVFSPDGETIAFAAVNNGQYQLWQVRGQLEEALVKLAGRPNQILWPAGRDFLLYRVKGSVWQYNFEGQAATKLLDNAGARELLGYEPEIPALWFIRENNNARNIWRRDLKTGAEKQLTFGSVGTAVELHGRIYFQYTGQRGLWQLDIAQQNPEQISVNLPSNSNVLHMTDDAAFFVAGGACRESAVQKLDLHTDEVTTVLERDKAMIASHDFHPAQGVLQSSCMLPESNIVEMIPSFSPN